VKEVNECVEVTPRFVVRTANDVEGSRSVATSISAAIAEAEAEAEGTEMKASHCSSSALERWREKIGCASCWTRRFSRLGSDKKMELESWRCGGQTHGRWIL
jgi:hypothetical protein